MLGCLSLSIIRYQESIALFSDLYLPKFTVILSWKEIRQNTVKQHFTRTVKNESKDIFIFFLMGITITCKYIVYNYSSN